MMRRNSARVFLTLAAAALILALAALTGLLPPTPRRGPQDIQEAITIAEALHLYWGSDEHDGVPVNFLVLSEFPITQAGAANLRVNDPAHPGWLGTVRLCRPWQSMQSNYDPACSIFWGNFFVYGDPQLIRKLVR